MEQSTNRSRGYQEYWKDGKKHRLDGPAIEYRNGSTEWWIDGKKLDKKKIRTWFLRQNLDPNQRIPPAYQYLFRLRFKPTPEILDWIKANNVDVGHLTPEIELLFKLTFK